MHNMEVAAEAAGTDANGFRQKYPGLALMGNSDKRAEAGRKVIDAEIERLSSAVKTGRLILEFDHLVPPDASWAGFAYYAWSLKELTGKR